MKKKSNGDDKILKQDMSQTADRPGMIFMIHLLMVSYKLKILEIRNSKAHIQCSGILIVDGYAELYEQGKIRIIEKDFMEKN